MLAVSTVDDLGTEERGVLLGSVVLEALCSQEAITAILPKCLLCMLPSVSLVCLLLNDHTVVFLIYRNGSFSQNPAAASLCCYEGPENSYFLVQHPGPCPSCQRLCGPDLGADMLCEPHAPDFL